MMIGAGVLYVLATLTMHQQLRYAETYKRKRMRMLELYQEANPPMEREESELANKVFKSYYPR